MKIDVVGLISFGPVLVNCLRDSGININFPSSVNTAIFPACSTCEQPFNRIQ